MFEIHFYEDEGGNSPIYEYIKDLSKRTDKNSRINATKIQDYIRILRENGKAAGEPFIKHIDGDIWELRPIKIGYFLQVGRTMALFCFTILSRKHKRPQGVK